MKSLIMPATVVALTSLISACGGGGSGDSGTSPTTPTAPTTPTTPDASIDDITIIDDVINRNQAVELFLLSDSQDLTPRNITWQQTGGSVVEITSPTATSISVTPTVAGNYEFQASFNLNGQNTTLNKSFTVTSESALVSIHSGHSVVEGNKVSLRAVINSSVNPDNLSWRQTAGPTVTLEQGTSPTTLVIYFDAPQVNRNTLVSFEVTDNLSGAQDTAAVIIEDKSPINANAYFDEPVATVSPYNPDSPYRDVIVGCIYSNQLSSSCTLGTLPLIANDTTTPTVDDIMDRVVVSHQWMGDRFKFFLENYDINDDFKNLLRATTGVVLSYDVRPSFYWAATGAIYLDPENLWQTAAERDTINEAPDFRASFGSELQFIMPWRYVNGNNYAYSRQSRNDRSTRNINDYLHRLTSLLYHELAHANDFFPASEWNSHQSSDRILDAAQSTNWESDKLAATFPLGSDVMSSLAQVSFRGESATPTQSGYLPSDIANFFSNDDATDYYNYSTTREDLAMLFEELLMQARYGIRRDVAITNLPTGDNVTITDYIVSWGQRGRVAEPTIARRAEYVTRRILPEFDVTQAINNLPAPIPMIAGDDWLENLSLSVVPNSTNSKEVLNQIQRLRQHSHHAVEILPYGHKDLPKH